MEQKKKGTARISDEAVRRKTGKGWDEWTLILDEWDVKAWGHRMTARYLREFFGLSPWWARTVTNRHERLKGVNHPTAKAGGLCLCSTATLHTVAGSQLWLHRTTHQGQSTSAPYSSSLAG